MENQKLEKEVEDWKVLAAKYKSGYIPKSSKDLIVQDVLAPWFSKGQIEVYCNEERKYIRNPCESDFSFAMQVRRSSKIKALDLVRTKIPLPSVSCLQKKFGWLHVLPGLIKAVTAYYSLKIPKMKPSEELSAVCFDEINTSDLRDLNIKYDKFFLSVLIVQSVLLFKVQKGTM